jgi:hypothetical protein
MPRRIVATALALLVLVGAGCAGVKSSDAVPPDPSPPPGLRLRLTPARAQAGGLVTLRIEGEAAGATSTGVTADFQRWDGRSWRTEFLLDAWGSGASRPSAVPAGEQHFVVGIAQVGTQPLPLKVPPVEPGEYRIVKELTQERPVVRERVVLYGRLRVVHQGGRLIPCIQPRI